MSLSMRRDVSYVCILVANGLTQLRISFKIVIEGKQY